MQPNPVDGGFPLIDPTGISSALKVRSVSKCAWTHHGWPSSNRQETNKFGQGKFGWAEPTEPGSLLREVNRAFRQYTPMDPQADESRGGYTSIL